MCTCNVHVSICPCVLAHACGNHVHATTPPHHLPACPLLLLLPACPLCRCRPPPPPPCAARAARQARLQAALEALMTIITHAVNDKKEHIPPVVSASVITFPFEIVISGYGSDALSSAVPCGLRVYLLVITFMDLGFTSWSLPLWT